MRTLPSFTVGLLLVALLSVVSTAPAFSAVERPNAPSSAPPSALLVENVGQYEDNVSFAFLNGPGETRLAPDGIWITLFGDQDAEGMARGTRLHISFRGASPASALVPSESLPTRISFLFGSDPAGWRASVPVWGTVRYRDLYPGIDLVFGEGPSPTWPWRLEGRSGGSLSGIALTVVGADAVAVEDGELRVITRDGALALPLPSGAIATGPASLAGARAFTVGLALSESPSAQAAHAAAPASGAADLVYGSYLGGSGSDNGFAVHVDGSGDAYLAGRTLSANFPTKGTPGPFDPTYTQTDAFVAKLRPAGGGASDLLYATYLGGAGLDAAYAVAADAGGNAYVGGSTRSNDFPVTSGAFDNNCGASDDCDSYHDAFLAVLNPGGAALLYATYAGGDNSDLAYGVAVAGSVAYLVGETSSADFPTTPSGYDTTCGANGACDTASSVPYADAFLLKIDRNLSGAGSLVYGTYLGGLDTDVANAVAASGSQATVAGYTFSSGFPGGGFAGETDAFATRINTAVSGSGGLLYSRLTGGAAYDEARAVALDASGNALIAGETRSTDFPGGQGACNGGGKDGFLSRVTPSGSINYSACIGGSAWDYAQGVAVGPDGLVSLAGYTRSTDFPTTPGAFDLALTGPSDMFAARLDLNLSPALVYATYLGGMDDDEAYGVSVAPDGNAYIGGITEVGGYPTTSNAFDVSYNGGTRDAVLAVLTLRPTGNLQITKIVNWNGVTPPASRNFNICITGPSYLGGNCKDFTYPDGLVQTWANLIPGQYAVTETNPGSQWQVEIAGSPAAVPGDGGQATASVKNTRLPDKPPQPPVVIISASVPDAVLTWAPVTQDVDGGDIVVVKYQVWRSTQPYFNPAGLPLAEVLAPTVTFTDVGALADTSTNYYYVVRAVSEAGLTSADSNRTGEFVFDLVKGS